MNDVDQFLNGRLACSHLESELIAYARLQESRLADLTDKLARSERELLTMTSDRNGVKLINEQHRATIADLTARLATAMAEVERSHREFDAMQIVAKDAIKERDAQQAARRDEESWWKEKHDYQARAESAESALATATAQLAWAESKFESSQRLAAAMKQAAEGHFSDLKETRSALAAATARCGELEAQLATTQQQLAAANAELATARQQLKNYSEKLEDKIAAKNTELAQSKEQVAQLEDVNGDLYNMAIQFCLERGWSKHPTIDKAAAIRAAARPDAEKETR